MPSDDDTTLLEGMEPPKTDKRYTTSEMKQRLESVDPASSMPPGEDHPDREAARRQLVELVTLIKEVATANIQSIEEQELTRAQSERQAKQTRNLGYLVLVVAAITVVVAGVLSRRVIQSVEAAESRMKRLETNMAATLKVVRHNARALALKVQADVEDMDPQFRTVKDEKALRAAKAASSAAVKADQKISPPKPSATAASSK